MGEHGGVAGIIVQGNGLQIGVRPRKAAGGDHRPGEGRLSIHQLQVDIICSIIGRYITLRLPLRLLLVQPVNEVEQAVRHDSVAQVAGVVHVIEILPLGDHPVSAAKLGTHRFQHIHHGHLVPIADGGQAAFQVPVVGKHREQQDHRRMVGPVQHMAHQALIEHALRLVSCIVDGKLDDHQIRLHRALPGDVPAVAHQAGLRGSAPHAGLDVADVPAIPLAQALTGDPGIAVFLQRHRPGPLGDGAAQKGHGHFFPGSGPAEEGLDSRIVPRTEEGPGDHLPVPGALGVHGWVGVLLRDLEAFVYITYHGHGGHVGNRWQFKSEFSQPCVGIAPLQRPQLDHPFRPIGGEGEAVAAAGVSFADQGKIHRHPGLPGDGDADAVHQLPKPGHVREQIQDIFILNAPGDPGEGGQPVTADENGVPAPAIVLGDAPHLLVEQHIEPGPFPGGILGCHWACHNNRLLKLILLVFYSVSRPNTNHFLRFQ